MKKETKEKFVTLRLPESVYLDIKEDAESETRTISAQILHLLKQAMYVQK